MVTFTTSPIYYKPLVPRITIKSLDGGTTYYTYDPWTDSGTTTKAIACSVNLSQNHQGIFTVQIEDQTGAISSNVNLGARVIIECGKQSTQMTRLISGLIRQKGYSRGADRKRLLTLSGSSTAIRLNEIITNQDIEARKLAQDNITIDTTDPAFIADFLLENQLAGLSAEGVASATGLTTRSDVENFIPSMTVNFGELQEVCNLIEEQTNGEIFMDINDLIQFRHQLQPTPSAAGRGFTIKNKNTTNDNADDTCYLRGKSWDYTESCLKSDGYSSRVYGILPAETVPSTREEIGYRLISGLPTNAAVTVTQELAAKFRPTHSHFLPGDIMIVGGENSSVAPLDAWVTRFRICTNTGGVPTNAGGVVGNIDFLPVQFQSPVPGAPVDESFVVMSEQIFYNSANVRIDSFDLDTTSDYWLIASNDNLAASHQFAWAGNIKAGAVSMVNTTAGLSTNSAGGSGWAAFGTAALLSYALPRRRSQAFECADPKAIFAIGTGLTTGGTRIESTLTSLPAGVTTKEAMQKYIVNQLYYMARPRSNWNMATVTAPNVPILPGDPIMISDTVMGFSTLGTQAIMTTCGDMTYSWPSYQAPTLLSIQPVGNSTHYN